MQEVKSNTEYYSQLSDLFFEEVVLEIAFNDELSYKRDVKKIIYHYTTLETLIKIIENQSLWATNTRFLNDRDEFFHGQKIIIKLLKDFIDQENFDREYIEILKAAVTNLERFAKTNQFVICFSNNGDLISQWRAYANNGKGVSIGFDRTSLTSSLAEPVTGQYVVYDSFKKELVVRTFFEKSLFFFKEKKKLFPSEEFDFNKVAAELMIGFLEIIISAYKDPSFAEEMEYRIRLKTSDHDENQIPNKRFRSNGNLIIPYVELETKFNEYKKLPDGNGGTVLVEQLPISEVIIGPCLDFIAVSDGLSQLLKENNYDNVKIKQSQIPYRV